MAAGTADPAADPLDWRSGKVTVKGGLFKAGVGSAISFNNVRLTQTRVSFEGLTVTQNNSIVDSVMAFTRIFVVDSSVISIDQTTILSRAARTINITNVTVQASSSISLSSSKVTTNYPPDANAGSVSSLTGVLVDRTNFYDQGKLSIRGMSVSILNGTTSINVPIVGLDITRCDFDDASFANVSSNSWDLRTTRDITVVSVATSNFSNTSAFRVTQDNATINMGTASQMMAATSTRFDQKSMMQITNCTYNAVFSPGHGFSGGSLISGKGLTFTWGSGLILGQLQLTLQASSPPSSWTAIGLSSISVLDWSYAQILSSKIFMRPWTTSVPHLGISLSGWTVQTESQVEISQCTIEISSTVTTITGILIEKSNFLRGKLNISNSSLTVSSGSNVVGFQLSDSKLLQSSEFAVDRVNSIMTSGGTGSRPTTAGVIYNTIIASVSSVVLIDLNSTLSCTGECFSYWFGMLTVQGSSLLRLQSVNLSSTIPESYLSFTKDLMLMLLADSLITQSTIQMKSISARVMGCAACFRRQFVTIRNSNVTDSGAVQIIGNNITFVATPSSAPTYTFLHMGTSNLTWSNVTAAWLQWTNWPILLVLANNYFTAPPTSSLAIARLALLETPQSLVRGNLSSGPGGFSIRLWCNMNRTLPNATFGPWSALSSSNLSAISPVLQNETSLDQCLTCSDPAVQCITPEYNMYELYNSTSSKYYGPGEIQCGCIPRRLEGLWLGVPSTPPTTGPPSFRTVFTNFAGWNMVSGKNSTATYAIISCRVRGRIMISGVLTSANLSVINTVFVDGDGPFTPYEPAPSIVLPMSLDNTTDLNQRGLKLTSIDAQSSVINLSGCSFINGTGLTARTVQIRGASVFTVSSCTANLSSGTMLDMHSIRVIGTLSEVVLKDNTFRYDVSLAAGADPDSPIVPPALVRFFQLTVAGPGSSLTLQRNRLDLTLPATETSKSTGAEMLPDSISGMALLDTTLSRGALTMEGTLCTLTATNATSEANLTCMLLMTSSPNTQVVLRQNTLATLSGSSSTGTAQGFILADNSNRLSPATYEFSGNTVTLRARNATGVLVYAFGIPTSSALSLNVTGNAFQTTGLCSFASAVDVSCRGSFYIVDNSMDFRGGVAAGAGLLLRPSTSQQTFVVKLERNVMNATAPNPANPAWTGSSVPLAVSFFSHYFTFGSLNLDLSIANNTYNLTGRRNYLHFITIGPSNFSGGALSIQNNNVLLNGAAYSNRVVDLDTVDIRSMTLTMDGNSIQVSGKPALIFRASSTRFTSCPLLRLSNNTATLQFGATTPRAIRMSQCTMKNISVLISGNTILSSFQRRNTENWDKATFFSTGGDRWEGGVNLTFQQNKVFHRFQGGDLSVTMTKIFQPWITVRYLVVLWPYPPVQGLRLKNLFLNGVQWNMTTNSTPGFRSFEGQKASSTPGMLVQLSSFQDYFWVEIDFGPSSTLSLETLDTILLQGLSGNGTDAYGYGNTNSVAVLLLAASRTILRSSDFAAGPVDANFTWNLKDSNATDLAVIARGRYWLFFNPDLRLSDAVDSCGGTSLATVRDGNDQTLIRALALVVHWPFYIGGRRSAQTLFGSAWKWNNTNTSFYDATALLLTQQSVFNAWSSGEPNTQGAAPTDSMAVLARPPTGRWIAARTDTAKQFFAFACDAPTEHQVVQSNFTQSSIARNQCTDQFVSTPTALRMPVQAMQLQQAMTLTATKPPNPDAGYMLDGTKALSSAAWNWSSITETFSDVTNCLAPTGYCNFAPSYPVQTSDEQILIIDRNGKWKTMDQPTVFTSTPYLAGVVCQAPPKSSIIELYNLRSLNASDLGAQGVGNLLTLSDEEYQLTSVPWMGSQVMWNPNGILVDQNSFTLVLDGCNRYSYDFLFNDSTANLWFSGALKEAEGESRGIQPLTLPWTMFGVKQIVRSTCPVYTSSRPNVDSLFWLHFASNNNTPPLEFTFDNYNFNGGIRVTGVLNGVILRIKRSIIAANASVSFEADVKGGSVVVFDSIRMTTSVFGFKAPTISNGRVIFNGSSIFNSSAIVWMTGSRTIEGSQLIFDNITLHSSIVALRDVVISSGANVVVRDCNFLSASNLTLTGVKVINSTVLLERSLWSITDTLLSSSFSPAVFSEFQDPSSTPLGYWTFLSGSWTNSSFISIGSTFDARSALIPRTTSLFRFYNTTFRGSTVSIATSTAALTTAPRTVSIGECAFLTLLLIDNCTFAGPTTSAVTPANPAQCEARQLGINANTVGAGLLVPAFPKLNPTLNGVRLFSNSFTASLTESSGLLSFYKTTFAGPGTGTLNCLLFFNNSVIAEWDGRSTAAIAWGGLVTARYSTYEGGLTDEVWFNNSFLGKNTGRAMTTASASYLSGWYGRALLQLVVQNKLTLDTLCFIALQELDPASTAFANRTELLENVTLLVELNKCTGQTVGWQLLRGVFEGPATFNLTSVAMNITGGGLITNGLRIRRSKFNYSERTDTLWVQSSSILVAGGGSSTTGVELSNNNWNEGSSISFRSSEIIAKAALTTNYSNSIAAPGGILFASDTFDVGAKSGGIVLDEMKVFTADGTGYGGSAFRLSDFAFNAPNGSQVAFRIQNTNLGVQSSGPLLDSTSGAFGLSLTLKQADNWKLYVTDCTVTVLSDGMAPATGMLQELPTTARAGTEVTSLVNVRVTANSQNAAAYGYVRRERYDGFVNNTVVSVCCSTWNVIGVESVAGFLENGTCGGSETIRNFTNVLIFVRTSVAPEGPKLSQGLLWTNASFSGSNVLFLMTFVSVRQRTNGSWISGDGTCLTFPTEILGNATLQVTGSTCYSAEGLRRRSTIFARLPDVLQGMDGHVPFLRFTENHLTVVSDTSLPAPQVTMLQLGCYRPGSRATIVLERNFMFLVSSNLNQSVFGTTVMFLRVSPSSCSPILLSPATALSITLSCNVVEEPLNSTDWLIEPRDALVKASQFSGPIFNDRNGSASYGQCSFLPRPRQKTRTRTATPSTSHSLSMKQRSRRSRTHTSTATYLDLNSVNVTNTTTSAPQNSTTLAPSTTSIPIANSTPTPGTSSTPAPLVNSDSPSPPNTSTGSPTTTNATLSPDGSPSPVTLSTTSSSTKASNAPPTPLPVETVTPAPPTLPNCALYPTSKQFLSPSAAGANLTGSGPLSLDQLITDGSGNLYIALSYADFRLLARLIIPLVFKEPLDPSWVNGTIATLAGPDPSRSPLYNNKFPVKAEGLWAPNQNGTASSAIGIQLTIDFVDTDPSNTLVVPIVFPKDFRLCRRTGAGTGAPMADPGDFMFNISLVLSPASAGNGVPATLTRAVATVAAVTGGISSLTGQASIILTQQRANTVQQLQSCSFSHTEPLSSLVSPLQLGFGRSIGYYYRGAVVGNLILLAALIAFFLLLAGLLLIVRRFDPIRSKTESLSEAAWDCIYSLHFPSVIMVPMGLGYQGTVATSIALLIHMPDPSDSVDIFIGVSGLVVCGVTLLLMFALAHPRFYALKLSVRHRFQHQRTRRSTLHRIRDSMEGRMQWVDRVPGSNFKRKWLLFFNDYRYPFGTGVEFAMAAGLGVIDGIRISNISLCGYLSITAAAGVVLYEVFIVVLDMALSPFEQLFLVTMNGFAAIAAVLLVVARYIRSDALADLTDWIGFSATVLGLIHFLIDLLLALLWFKHRGAEWKLIAAAKLRAPGFLPERIRQQLIAERRSGIDDGDLRRLNRWISAKAEVAIASTEPKDRELNNIPLLINHMEDFVHMPEAQQFPGAKEEEGSGDSERLLDRLSLDSDEEDDLLKLLGLPPKAPSRPTTPQVEYLPRTQKFQPAPYSSAFVASYDGKRRGDRGDEGEELDALILDPAEVDNSPHRNEDFDEVLPGAMYDLHDGRSMPSRSILDGVQVCGAGPGTLTLKEWRWLTSRPHAGRTFSPPTKPPPRELHRDNDFTLSDASVAEARASGSPPQARLLSVEEQRRLGANAEGIVTSPAELLRIWRRDTSSTRREPPYRGRGTVLKPL